MAEARISHELRRSTWYRICGAFCPVAVAARSLSSSTTKWVLPRPSHSTVLLVPFFPEVDERCRSPVVPGFAPGRYRGMPRRRSPRPPGGFGGWKHEHSPIRIGPLACQVRVRVLDWTSSGPFTIDLVGTLLTRFCLLVYCFVSF